MRYVYVVSPDYLEAMYEQSIPFSFDIKGFCSIEQGIKNLGRTNISEIIGFAIVLHSLPTELSPLIELINKINKISKNQTLVLSLYIKDGIEILQQYLEIYNLDFYVLTNFEDVTDSLLKRGVYGTILKNVYKPYIHENDDTNEIDLAGSPNIEHYTPILNERVRSMLSNTINAPSISRSREVDSVLNSYLESGDEMMYFLRDQRIKKRYNEDLNSDEIFDGLLKREKNSKDRILYRSLYKLIKEDRI